ncbi:enterobactin transporter EntS [Brenneria izadpanahii]|uniref:Multidrug efflux pump Tap n=1 Tax=Brenneria izadpanahii TaxID=2722756 RepID=A0ABX7USM1_9GAMM|nr:enterobactin transporter EntS [Brenneria izadpanahii]QTF08736.1 enterobactin transporter EntS [Brenneria izadpanahii]
MDKNLILTAFHLLKGNRPFRAVFYARALSILSLGMLTVAIPVQIQWMTGSVMLVGLSVTLAGGGMFSGLLLGGVLADRYDRRTMILFGRSVCGLGFAGLALNALAPSPSLSVMYFLSVWDGFFGAMSITALLAATPALVGRENIAVAGVINMMMFRIGTVIAPTLGGLVIAYGGVTLNYSLAAVGTFLTLIPLLTLPSMPSGERTRQHPARALWQSVQFVLSQRIIWTMMLIGGMVSAIAAVRVLFPALAEQWRVDLRHLGLLYSAMPLGAVIGMLTSRRWVDSGWRTERVMFISAYSAFTAIVILGIVSHFATALIFLMVYGYFSAINSVLQFIVVQNHTPNNLLGRVNGLWMAQNVGSDMAGAFFISMAGAIMMPTMIAIVYGGTALIAGIIILLIIRRYGEPVRIND